MRVFMTGATGFIGSYLVPELLNGGHEVVGLCRSEEGANKLKQAGAEPFLGDVNDVGRVGAGAQDSDGVIHAAFNHDFARIRHHSEEDRRVIEALGAALTGSDRPFIVTSGTGLVERQAGKGCVMETDAPASSEKAPRAATEEAANVIIAMGVCGIVVRLPQVHDTRHQGRIAHHIRLAKEKGYVAYVGDGGNRLPAVHISDAVHLFRIALERGRPDGPYHAVAEEGVPMRDIASVIGTGLNLPVESITPEEASGYFGVLAGLASQDLAASADLTREKLGWTPTGPGLLADLRQMEWTSK
jgi:nucleoside-diphosphate-sugar epimerase